MSEQAGQTMLRVRDVISDYENGDPNIVKQRVLVFAYPAYGQSEFLEKHFHLDEGKGDTYTVQENGTVEITFADGEHHLGGVITVQPGYLWREETIKYYRKVSPEKIAQVREQAKQDRLLH